MQKICCFRERCFERLQALLRQEGGIPPQALLTLPVKVLRPSDGDQKVLEADTPWGCALWNSPCCTRTPLQPQGTEVLSSADAAPFLKSGQRANKCKGCSTSCEVKRGDGTKPSILLGGKGRSALRKETRAKWWVYVCPSEPHEALLPLNPGARGMGPTFRL